MRKPLSPFLLSVLLVSASACDGDKAAKDEKSDKKADKRMTRSR